jgi:ribosomal protein L19E
VRYACDAGTSKGRFEIVTKPKKNGGGRRRAGPAKGGKSHSQASKPEWAKGLRALYDSVVDEPLPDNFKALLDKLDKRK